MYSVFLPVLFMVGLTFSVDVFLVIKRQAGVKADPTLLERSALDVSVYQDDARKVEANLRNLFETPVLFYVGAIFAILFGATGAWVGFLCWTYVLARIAHTVIHTTINMVLIRFAAFGVSLLALALLWITLAVRAGDSGAFDIGELDRQPGALERHGPILASRLGGVR